MVGFARRILNSVYKNLTSYSQLENAALNWQATKSITSGTNYDTEGEFSRDQDIPPELLKTVRNNSPKGSIALNELVLDYLASEAGKNHPDRYNYPGYTRLEIEALKLHYKESLAVDNFRNSYNAGFRSNETLEYLALRNPVYSQQLTELVEVFKKHPNYENFVKNYPNEAHERHKLSSAEFAAVEWKREQELDQGIDPALVERGLQRLARNPEDLAALVVEHREALSGDAKAVQAGVDSYTPQETAALYWVLQQRLDQQTSDHTHSILDSTDKLSGDQEHMLNEIKT